MRAIKIDSGNFAITEIQISGDLKSLQKEVGGYITQAFRIPKTNAVCFVDDEGLLKKPKYFFESSYYPGFLAGNGIIVGIDGAGNTTDCKVSLSKILDSTTFFTNQEIIL